MGRGFTKCMSGVLTAALVLTGTAWTGTETKAAEPAQPSLTVDMSKAGDRELYHGATGWLYGQGDDQVPSANTITALKPNTAVQKAPNGMQHPNGDVLDIAKTFLNAGGEHIQIYVPDYYALWFYEFTGTEYYMKILEMQAKACMEAGIAEDVVYVLYNEPTADWIGGSYQDHSGNTVRGWDSMNWFWLDMVEKLREIYRDAGIPTEPKTAGLNLAVYSKDVMENYVKFCAEHDCMPDIVSWHDLATWQYNIFDEEYSHYRGLEKKYGVEPREIVINEYAAQSECASPGDLVRWIGLWEDYEVAGCLPYWHFSNNLNGLAADTNEGNGAWWPYKWYGDMSGSYLPVQVENASQDDFYGAASIDENKKNADVVFGGRDKDAQIVLDQILDTDTFRNAEKVHVKVESTDYTGFHGSAEEPRVVKEGAVDIADGRAVIPMTDMNEMTAYHITVTQASEGEASGLLAGTWKKVYEAEGGILTGHAQVADADSSYACSNRRKVHYVDNPGDSVTLEVSVPRSGYYKYDMVYCAATGVNTNDPDHNTPYTAVQNLIVDGSHAAEMVLPSTLHWSMGGMYSTFLYLEQGSHTLKIEATASQGKAVPDCVYLTYKGTTEEATGFDKIYEAELGEFNEIKGKKTALTTEKEGDVGFITGLEQRKVQEGGGVRFNVVVPDNGMYTMNLSYQAEEDTSVNIYLDNDMVNLDRLRASIPLKASGGSWKLVSQTLFLQKGINVVDIDAENKLKLDSIRILERADSRPVAAVEAEDGTMSGEAAVGKNQSVIPYASGNAYVSGLKAANGVELIPEGDAEFTILGMGRQVDQGKAVNANSLTLKVTVPSSGEYRMLVYQSNGELFGKHSYNAQMTERYASFLINGQEAKKVVFRNTYSEETFRPQAVSVQLDSGENTIQIYNDNSKVVTNGVLKQGTSAHRPENIDYGVLDNCTPNFDRFEFYKVTGEPVPEETRRYQVTVRTTGGGQIEADREKAEEGSEVQLVFRPESGYILSQAYVNGSSVMDRLTDIGGVYTVRGISGDVKAEAYFSKTQAEEIQRENDYEYTVNAGDIDPKTLSRGDVFGLRNGVTDQFYGKDSSTGYEWGVLDTYQESSAYPKWLTGEKTWPCENDGATDTSPKTKSFRYARNQETSDAGVVYQFSLEKGQSYDVELGFYVPSSWTNASNPRTMKLLLNDEPEAGYQSFTASNDSEHPYVVHTRAAADSEGNLKIQIGHADSAVWGPVISYVNIYRPAETEELERTINSCLGHQEKDYTPESWKTFKTALKTAEELVAESGSLTNRSGINEAQYQLQAAAARLEIYGGGLDTLLTLCEKYASYEEEYGQGLTEDADWAEFQDALRNAQFLASQSQITVQIAADAALRLEKAAENLRIKPEETILQSIHAEASKTMYQVGEKLVPSSITVTAQYSDGSRLKVTDFQVTGFDSSRAGANRIRITYQGCSADLELTIRANSEQPVQKLPAVKVKVKAAGYRMIRLGWSLSAGAAGYEIYRSSAKNGTYRKVNTIWNGNTVTFTDTGKTFNRKYYYKIKAFKKAGEGIEYSAFSNTLTARTALAKPVMKVKKKSASAVKVTWKGVTGATGYQIQYSRKKKSGYQSITIKKGKTKGYTLSRLKRGRRYYIKMRAGRRQKGKMVYGAWSGPKSIKIK